MFIRHPLLLKSTTFLCESVHLNIQHMILLRKLLKLTWKKIYWLKKCNIPIQQNESWNIYMGKSFFWRENTSRSYSWTIHVYKDFHLPSLSAQISNFSLRIGALKLTKYEFIRQINKINREKKTSSLQKAISLSNKMNWLIYTWTKVFF